MSRYAANTQVPTDRSRGEIEAILRRYGADQFVSGWDNARAMLAFRVHDRHVRFELPIPSRDDDDFRFTPSKAYVRSAKQQDEAYEQELRRRWRALALIVRAKLEAIDSGIATFDDEFLAYLVLPSGSTVGQMLGDGRLDEALANGAFPALVPGAVE